jgi:hypothetical protein
MVPVARAAILAAPYVALTTFRRDGRAVTTPVWAAVDEGLLYLFTNAGAGKVKRLRRSSRATVAPCTATGRITGDTIDAEARILPADHMPRVWRLLIARHGLLARAFALYDAVRPLVRLAPSVGIEVRLTD